METSPFRVKILPPLKDKYSVNELELLVVVWVVEHFKQYLYEIKFQVVSDHKALATVLESNKNKNILKSNNSWVDRLIPFDFEIFHAPARPSGLADYLLRHPSQIGGESVKTAELWNNWFFANHVKIENSV